LRSISRPDHLDVALDDPGGFNESWKLEILAGFGNQLNIKRLIVVRPRVDIDPLNTSSLGTMYTGMSTSISYRG